METGVSGQANNIKTYFAFNTLKKKNVKGIKKVGKSKLINHRGYIKELLDKDDPFLVMAHKDGYILQHRYVMAKTLGRILEKWEIVHHINGVKHDNNPSNLMILDKSTHDIISFQTMRIKELESEIVRLKEIIWKQQ